MVTRIFKTFREFGLWWFKRDYSNLRNESKQPVKSGMSRRQLDRFMRNNREVGATPRFDDIH